MLNLMKHTNENLLLELLEFISNENLLLELLFGGAISF